MPTVEPQPARAVVEAGAPLGLIAGAGELPMLQAAGMRAAGHPVMCLGLGGWVDPALRPMVQDYARVGVLRPVDWAKRLQRMGVTRAVMVGRVPKEKLLYDPWAWVRNRPNVEVLRLGLPQLRRDMRSQTILGMLTDLLARRGVTLMDTTAFIPEHLATPGVMTPKGPSGAQQSDIEFGWPLLMEMNRMEIGQAIAVKNRDVVAVEAVEGTDRMIARCGELAGRGWVLLKGAPADKDPRFDVPVVGLQTIEKLKLAKAGAVALAVGRVILIDKPRVLEAAAAAGIALVGVTAD